MPQIKVLNVNPVSWENVEVQVGDEKLSWIFRRYRSGIWETINYAQFQATLNIPMKELEEAYSLYMKED